MSYQFAKAENPLNIQEQEWGIGAEIRFSTFTSCIGIVALLADKKQLIGIHLVMIDKSGVKFSQGGIEAVMALLQDKGAQLETVHVVGQVEMWSFNLHDAFQQLMAQLKGPKVKDDGDGDYCAHADNGKVVVNFKSK